MTEERPQLWLKASPQGRRSGFVVLPDGLGGQVSFTVLPKPWASRGKAVREVRHTPTQTTHLVLHEGELAAVSAPEQALGALALGLNDAARSHAGLLELAGAPKHRDADVDIGDDPWEGLLDLALLVERSVLRNHDGIFEGDYAPAVLRLITFERLVREAERILFRARPRYSERTELLSVPRGRLSAESLLVSAASGIPQIRATFDELSMDTPLLRITRAALLVVASTRFHPKVQSLRPGLAPRATQLLHYLQNVTPLERSAAGSIAERLHLTPLDRPWRETLAAAVPVLSDEDVAPISGSFRSPVISLLVSTEKVWEQCLEIALATAFSDLHVNREGALAAGVTASPPWLSQRPDAPATEGLMAPDFLLRNGSATVLVDAKYKLSTRPTIDAADAYQLFAYSHLAQLHGRRADLAAVLRPARDGQVPEQAVFTRQPDSDIPLWVASLPFPSRADVRDASRWRAYSDKLASQLVHFGAEWV